MLEKLIASLDYFDNNGNGKLEAKMRVLINELDTDLDKAGYVVPERVELALKQLNETLEDVIDFEAENDLPDDEIVSAELEDEDEFEDDKKDEDEDDDPTEKAD